MAGRSTIPETWYNEFFDSEAWASLHVKTRTRDQTLKEVDFVKRVSPQRDSLIILDMPCGTGRHSIEFTKTGHTVVGVDGSQRLLKIANENAKDLRSPPEFLHADMRHFKRPTAFDMVLTLWGSLGYFSDDETLTLFGNIRESLKPGGIFVFDLPTLDTFMRSGFFLNHWSEHDDLYVLEKTHWIPESGRNESEWTFIENGKVSTHKSSIRIYTCHELYSMLQQAGFKSIKSFGSMELKPFTVGDRLFCVAGV